MQSEARLLTVSCRFALWWWEREDSNLRLPLLRVTICQRPPWGKNGNGVLAVLDRYTTFPSLR